MKIQSVEAYSVHKNDEFHFSLGLDNHLVHRPKMGDRGAIVAVYAIATMDNGLRTFGNGPASCDVTNGCDPEVAKIAAINDLVRFVEEQNQFQSILHPNDETIKKPAKQESEWPKWNEDLKAWIDADDVVYNKTVHAGYRGDKPSVNKDNTFRMKRAPKPKGDVKLVSHPGEV